MDVEAANTQLAGPGKLRACSITQAMLAEVIVPFDASASDSWTDASFAQMPTTPCEFTAFVGVELLRKASWSAG